MTLYVRLGDILRVYGHLVGGWGYAHRESLCETLYGWGLRRHGGVALVVVVLSDQATLQPDSILGFPPFFHES